MAERHTVTVEQLLRSTVCPQVISYNNHNNNNNKFYLKAPFKTPKDKTKTNKKQDKINKQ